MSALLITVLVAVLSVTALFVTLPLLSQSCSEQPAIDCYYQDLQHPVTNVAAQWWYTIEIAGQLYYLLIAVGLGISWLFGLLSGLSRRQISYLVGLTDVVAICVAVPLLAFQDEIGLLVWYVE